MNFKSSIMKKNILIPLALMFTVFLFNYSNVSSQTNIAKGYVSGNWTIAGSPYQILGNIMVANNTTLTIDPGVTVNFQGSYKFYVQGRVIATGTQTDSIVFTSADKIYGWGGLRFEKTPLTNDTSVFKYCKIQYGNAIGATPNDNGGAFYFSYFSKVIIANCLISNCKSGNYGGGIYCQNSDLMITNNTIVKNTSAWGGGIYCTNNNSAAAKNS